jgi:LacI family transcriptional regulator
VTLKEIAKLAGVSTATVSYVLNNSAPVKDETKKRVLSIVKSTGYTSNSIAKSLRVNKTKTIGIIVEDMTVIQVPILIDGINELAEINGYKTLLSNLRFLSKHKSKYDNEYTAKEDTQVAFNTLLGMQVDGIIYIGTYDKYIDELPNCTKPVVYCNCFGKQLNAINVSYNNMDAAYRITRQLIGLGHDAIGLITGRMDTYPAIERYKGYKKALSEYNIPLNHEYVVNGAWSYHKGKEAATKLFQLDNPPTGIFAMNDNMAIGVYEAAQEYEIRIPEDISVFGFDNAETSKYIRPRMSTVNIPLKDIGMKSTEILIKQIEGESIPQTQLLLPCEVVLRSSVTKKSKDTIVNC